MMLIEQRAEHYREMIGLAISLPLPIRTITLQLFDTNFPRDPKQADCEHPRSKTPRAKCRGGT